MSLRTIVLCLSLLGAVASAASATDEAYVWRTARLLGGNSREHMFLVTRHGSATGIERTDSVFVYERSNSDPRWTQRTLIRATLRRIWSDPDSSVLEAFVGTFDLGPYLVDHNCQPPYFLEWPESVAVDAKGMYCHRRGVRSYFMTRDEVLSWLDYDLKNLDSRGEDLRAVDLYQTTAREENGAKTDFIIVRAGSGSDAGEYEGIVAVADTSLRAAALEVQQKLLARKKPATKKR